MNDEDDDFDRYIAEKQDEQMPFIGFLIAYVLVVAFVVLLERLLTFWLLEGGA